MILKALKPRKALNKAFLKVKPNRTEIEGFKTNLITLLDRTNELECELKPENNFYDEVLQYRDAKQPVKAHVLVWHWAEDLKLDNNFEPLNEKEFRI